MAYFYWLDENVSDAALNELTRDGDIALKHSTKSSTRLVAIIAVAHGNISPVRDK